MQMIFMANMYRNVLGRDPDPEGLAFWSNAIAAGRSPESIYKDFLTSARANTELVTADQVRNATFADATKGRAIGIGVLGWHTFLQSKNLPFVGIQATAYTRMISDFIEKGALKASREQAELYGEPEWCKGTGMRHTHHLAIAPTVSNAHISGGVSPSIEPIPANVYNLKTAKGVFIKRNKILEDLLEKKGYNIYN